TVGAAATVVAVGIEGPRRTRPHHSIAHRASVPRSAPHHRVPEAEAHGPLMHPDPSPLPGQPWPADPVEEAGRGYNDRVSARVAVRRPDRGHPRGDPALLTGAAVGVGVRA